MTSSGRCHGPGCTQTARTEFFCSEVCQLNWDRQAAGLAPVKPWPPSGYVSPVTRAGGFLTPAAARSLTAIQRDLETRFAEALAVDHVQTPPTVPATVAVDGEVTRDTAPSMVEAIQRAAEMVRGMTPPPEPVKVTREQWAALRAQSPTYPPWAAPSTLSGVPVVLVDDPADATFPSDLAANPQVAPDPTRGWLSRWLDRLFGRTT